MVRNSLNAKVISWIAVNNKIKLGINNKIDVDVEDAPAPTANNEPFCSNIIDASQKYLEINYTAIIIATNKVEFNAKNNETDLIVCSNTEDLEISRKTMDISRENVTTITINNKTDIDAKDTLLTNATDLTAEAATAISLGRTTRAIKLREINVAYILI